MVCGSVVKTLVRDLDLHRLLALGIPAQKCAPSQQAAARLVSSEVIKMTALH